MLRNLFHKPLHPQSLHNCLSLAPPIPDLAVFEELRRLELIFANIGVVDIHELADGPQRTETGANTIADDDN